MGGLNLEMHFAQDLVDGAVGFQKHFCIALAALLPREQEVIRLRCGVEGPSQSLGKIAHRLGVSRARIAQIE